jgi:drug/metabolite transporter (DMT)-like permease
MMPLISPDCSLHRRTPISHQIMSKTSASALSPITVGFMFALASAAMFAIRPIFVKLVYLENVDPASLIALRMLFSAPIYIVLFLIFLRDPQLRARLNPRLIAQISATGLLGYYAASYLDLLGLQYVTAQLGRMMLYTYPTLVVLLGAIFFKQKITWRVIVALLISYFGIALIFGHDFKSFGPDVVTGGLYITGSAISFALYLLLAKPLISQAGTRLFTCIALISASLAILLQFSATHTVTDSQMSSKAVWLILVIAIFCTVIPTFFTTAAVSRIGADRTGIVATVGPAFTSVAAVMVLGELFTGFHALGIGLTVFGVWVLHKT